MNMKIWWERWCLEFLEKPIVVYGEKSFLFVWGQLKTIIVKSDLVVAACEVILGY